ncbi:Fur family transcriptional regulator [Hymenobacter cellulosivorans]|uniref:Transcriptional repressor n=1 Tax=Hymenobacter cellulosivorans TaxID=2932249 RepID=A0ABY4F7N4_9BACT|nr:transcriptional repressor [Hymenobacter cellulosivorans]UOQ52671.1 transcriptional repressor [Hymenobacter cellulosivorans]
MATPDHVTLTLARHGLRQTPMRRAVLSVLFSKAFALSSNDIEQALAEDTDRITLYRTLRTFEQKGVIHRVLDSSDVIRFAACSATCTEQAHADDHVHFKCSVCQHTYCLQQVAIPAVQLPGGFQATHRDYLMSGVCEKCHAVK